MNRTFLIFNHSKKYNKINEIITIIKEKLHNKVKYNISSPVFYSCPKIIVCSCVSLTHVNAQLYPLLSSFTMLHHRQRSQTLKPWMMVGCLKSQFTLKL